MQSYTESDYIFGKSVTSRCIFSFPFFLLSVGGLKAKGSYWKQAVTSHLIGDGDQWEAWLGGLKKKCDDGIAGLL